jgi:hypothetical protein
MTRKGKAQTEREFRDEVERELAACFPNLQFEDRHVDNLAHCLWQYEHRPFDQAALQKWWKQLQADRRNKAAHDTTIAFLARRAEDPHRESAAVALAEVREIRAALDRDIEWLESLVGRGRKPRRLWAPMARVIGRFTLAALQSADALAGRAPRAGLGRLDGPALRFVHGRLVRILERTGEKPPGMSTLYDVLIGKP